MDPSGSNSGSIAPSDTDAVLDATQYGQDLVAMAFGQCAKRCGRPEGYVSGGKPPRGRRPSEHGDRARCNFSINCSERLKNCFQFSLEGALVFRC